MTREELKTLKDVIWRSEILEDYFNKNGAYLPKEITKNFASNEFVSVPILKAEAIKFIKNKEFDVDVGGEDKTKVIEVEWIKHFFNLTEDELKWERNTVISGEREVSG